MKKDDIKDNDYLVHERVGEVRVIRKSVMGPWIYVKPKNGDTFWTLCSKLSRK